LKLWIKAPTDHRNTKTRKGTGEDLAKGPTDLVVVYDKDDQSAPTYSTPMNGNAFSDFSDGFDATNDNRKHDDRKDQTSDPTGEIARDLVICACLAWFGTCSRRPAPRIQKIENSTARILPPGAPSSSNP
jgi:hypothetical protein